MNIPAIPILVAKLRVWVGRLRKFLNDGHEIGLWPNKTQGPDIKK